MEKIIWRKGLVAGVVALLIGLAVIPTITSTPVMKQYEQKNVMNIFSDDKCLGDKQEDTAPPEINIIEPKEGYLYILGKEIMPTPLGNTVILGGDIFYEPRFNDWWMYVVIEASASDTESGIKQVEFYIDDVLRNIDTQEPYEWAWSGENVFGQHDIKVVAYDNENNVASDEMDVIIFMISQR
jgi:hypothetical protein